MAIGNLLKTDYLNYIECNESLLFELANKNDSSAQYILGIKLLEKTPIVIENLNNKNLNKAIVFLEKSSKNKNIDAILQLIFVYKNILKIVVDKKNKDIYKNKIYELSEILKQQINFINNQMENINNGLDPFHYRFPKPLTKDNVEFVDTNTSLDKFTNLLNNKCKLKQDDEKEIISDETMYKAKDIVDSLTPNSVEDVLLYCSSLNILNTYVKQKQNKITYYFKNNVVDVLLNSIVENEIKDVTYNITYDRGMTICYVKIYNIIFSFHQVNLKDKREKIINYKQCKKIVFDDVRKQKVAGTIFYNILNYLDK